MPLILGISKNVHRAGSQNPNKRFVKGEAPLPQITASGYTGSVNFSDGGKGGIFHFVDADTVNYEPANRTQTVVITATDSLSDSDSVTLAVFATFPLYPQKGYEVEGDQETKSKQARDGSLYFAERFKPQITWKIPMDRRLLDETREIWDFVMFHKKTKLFWVYDEERRIMNRVRVTSSIPQKFESANSWSSSVVLKGDYEPIALIPATNTPFYINSGGFAPFDIWQEDRFFESGERFYFGEANSIDTSLLSPPIPPNTVLRYCRYDPVKIIYDIKGFDALQNYQLKLYFLADAEREVNIELNGSSLNTITIPGDYVAKLFDDSVTSDENGILHLEIIRTSGTNALISAIAIFGI